MSPKKKVQGMIATAGLTISLVASVIIFSSQKSLPATPSQAATIEISITASPTPTAAPTLLRPKVQDVPLKVLGSTAKTKENSYLYTELTSKGIISNISTSSATILWLTEAPQPTNLHFGTKERALVRSNYNKTPTYIHESVLDNLLPNTVYYFTGHAPITDSFTTPASISGVSLTEQLTGSIIGGSGTCLVRAGISRDSQSSAYVTSITTTANWKLSLSKLRTSDLSQYYQPTDTDIVELDALCVTSGKALYTGVKKLKYGELTHTILSIPVSREN